MYMFQDPEYPERPYFAKKMTMKPLILIRTKSTGQLVGIKMDRQTAASFKHLDPCVKIQSLKQVHRQSVKILKIFSEISGNTTLPDNYKQLFRPSYTGPDFRCPTSL